MTDNLAHADASDPSDALAPFYQPAMEDCLAALADASELPELALGICLIRIAEAAPALRAVLARAADGERLSEADAMLNFRGLYVLGGARDSQSCAPLLRLLRRPSDEIDDLLGDSVTVDMPKIVAGVFDGDAEALFAAIADPAAGEYVRDSLLRAAAFLTWDGRIARDRMRQFLEQFYAQRWAEDGDFAWTGWLDAIAQLGLRDLSPLARAALQNRLPEGVTEWSFFEADLAAAEAAPNDIARFRDAQAGYIDDILEVMEWTRPSQAPDDVFEPIEAVPEPVVNPWRHVGRNDPCPCGSGKKFKKCCIDTFG